MLCLEEDWSNEPTLPCYLGLLMLMETTLEAPILEYVEAVRFGKTQGQQTGVRFRF